MLEKTFADLFDRIDVMTAEEHNRTALHQKLHILQGDDVGKADDGGRGAVAVRLLRQDPAFGYIHGFDMLDAKQARLVLRKMLTDSAVHGNNELTTAQPSEEADAITNEFFGQFKPNATTFLTTSLWQYDRRSLNFEPRHIGGGGGPITGATFESALIAIDGEKLAYVVLEEED